MLTLVKTKEIKKVPIVLIGSDYWRPFMQWITDEAVPRGLVKPDQVSLFSVTDDLYKAFCFVKGECDIE